MMKKISKILTLLLLFFVFSSVVDAGNFATSPSSMSITVGQTKTFRITSSGGAEGSVSVVSANSSVASVVSISPSDGWVPTTGMTVTVRGVSVGTAVINVNILDAAGEDEVPITGTRKVTVNVVAPTTAAPAPVTQTPTTAPRATQAPTQKKTTVPTTQAPTQPVTEAPIEAPLNLKLDSLTVDDFEVRYENNKYYVTVNKDTESVNIQATADPRISIIGLGNRNLAAGKNVAEIILKHGEETKLLQVIITRPGEGEDSTKLKSLSVEKYSFNSNFTPNHYDYEVIVPFYVKEITVIAEAESEIAKIDGDGKQDIRYSENKIYINVTNGENDPTEYTIKVKKTYTALFVLGGVAGCGLALFAVLYLKGEKKKTIKELDHSDQLRVKAEDARKSLESMPDVSLNGKKVIGTGRRIIEPTLVKDLDKPKEVVMVSKNENIIEKPTIVSNDKIHEVKPKVNEIHEVKPIVNEVHEVKPKINGIHEVKPRIGSVSKVQGIREPSNESAIAQAGVIHKKVVKEVVPKQIKVVKKVIPVNNKVLSSANYSDDKVIITHID